MKYIQVTMFHNKLGDRKYRKRCNIIYNLLEKKFEGSLVACLESNSGDHMNILLENGKEVSLMPDSTLPDIERIIQKKLQTNDYGDCGICYNHIEKNVSCVKCSASWCGKCYVKLFETGEGVISCPFCKYSIGKKQSKRSIKIGVADIKMKLGLC